MTKGLKVFTSNRLEFLADDLAQLSRDRIGSIFQPEIVVVQSHGMARWLSLHLAESNSICANYRFPFPNAFAHQAFKALWPNLADQPDCRLEVLIWRVMQHLPSRLQEERFSDVRHYLGGESDSRKLFQLAQKIAWLFDQYLVFRPELIESWDAGHDDQWQAELWRGVSAGFKRPHIAALRKQFLKKITTKVDASKFPERVSVFGISALPAFHMELLEALSEKIEIHLFLLQPCKEFWGYITGPRETERALKQHLQLDFSSLHLERGNRLLASMGKLGRDFLNLVFQSDNLTPIERFSEPDESTLLSTIQSDILQLEDRGTFECPLKIISNDDDSIQIHSCHSPMREMEVLHDCILGWLGKDPHLKAGDILVLTPDIESYAPFVQAVFGCPESPARQIPFSLADRDPRSEGRILEPFFALLASSESRFGVVQVLTLLECAAIRQKFALSESDLVLIRRCVEDAGIRWGIDAQHRGTFGVPEFNANSWRYGLDNLLLGYAMSSDDEQLFGGHLPLNRVEGSVVHTLGSLIEFVEKLAAISAALAVPRSLNDWEALLRRICSDFFVLDEQTEREMKLLWMAAKKLRTNGHAAGFQDKVSLAVITEFLSAELREDLQPVGFLTGGVTFAALKPMRSLPFKIICLVGMNDDAFPRHASQLGFDLMAKDPQLGDRSVRDDDRYLFLESLVSPREKLHISYIGQSIRDNAPRPPSVLVSELMDYIAQGFTVHTEENILEKHVVVKHRLQAFHEDYFTGGKLVSFSRENFLASQALRRETQDMRPFFSTPLPPPPTESRVVNLEQLISFFCNPAEFIVKQRLGIRLPREEEELEEREPFTMDARQGYGIKEALVERALAGTDLQVPQKVLAASGNLPIGEAGKVIFEKISSEVTEFLGHLQPFCPRELQTAVDFDFSIGNFRLRGQLEGLTKAGLLRYRCAKLKGSDLLRLWIPHLVWNHIASESADRAVHVASDEIFSLKAVSNPSQLLAPLLEMYWSGLSMPQKFFPQSSHAFTTAKKRQEEGNTRVDPLREAWKQWNDSTIRDGHVFRTVPGENANPYVNLCFEGTEPLDTDFERLGIMVFSPILRHQISLT